MNTDIEKYIHNEMPPDERKRFEERLESDPALQLEVQELRALSERLKAQALREKMMAAIAKGGEEHPPEQTTRSFWTYWLVAGLLMVAALFWYFSQEQNENGVEDATPVIEDLPTETLPTDAAPIKTSPPEEKQEETPSPKITSPKQRPIAEKPAMEPPANNQGVRGEEGLNEDWEKLVESVWVTKFEPKEGEFNDRFQPVAELLKEKNTTDAFVQLYLLEKQTPENDTLAYLKGYCLLEMREGAQALGYFDKIKNKKSWTENIEWYKSLAYLINAEKEKTMREAKLITRNKNHLFYNEARKLLEVFR